MSRKIIKSIVVILGILIILALSALLYGIYIKISFKSSEIENYPENISFLLHNEDNIENLQVIDNNKILITVENNNQLIGLIYDIDKKKIIQRLTK
jgi:hypothetical protein